MDEIGSAEGNICGFTTTSCDLFRGDMGAVLGPGGTFRSLGLRLTVIRDPGDVRESLTHLSVIGYR